jgi:MinD-like ATPase involved in chromosome partitioning or flagellar assembly
MKSRIISIASAKGSPGCSFLAVALARFLAASKMPTLLVDGDAEGGGLGALLDLGPVLPLAAIPEGGTEGTALQIESRLWFSELGEVTAGQLNGLEVAAAARARHQAVVLDLGHSTGPMQRQLSAASDWLLWVVVPDRSGLERADKALASGVLGAARMGLVFNRIRRGCVARADEVLSSRHHIPVMARIMEDHRIAEQLSLGRPVHREWGLRRALRELARAVHPGAGSAALTWP